MNLGDLEFKKIEDTMIGGVRLKQMVVEMGGVDGQGLGIDPGKNFGFAVVGPHLITVAWGRLPPEGKAPPGISAFDFGKNVGEKVMPVTIEGAAHATEFGQVELAQIRFGFYMGLYYGRSENSEGLEIVPPNKIRKAVFGHGNAPAWKVWPLLSEHAADALGCALYAAGYRHEK